MNGMIPYLIMAGAAVLAALILTGVLLLRKQKLRRLGVEGERQVAAVLRRFAAIRSFKVMNDVYLPLYDQTTQVDHILIGFFGLRVVETKSYSGAVYGEPKKKEWLHVIGSQRHRFYNPVMQNQGHIDCIRHLLGKENLYSIQMESLVVFTRKKAELYLPKGAPVIRLSQLKRFLRQPRFAEDKGYDVEKIYEALKKHQVTDKKRIAAHAQNVEAIKSRASGEKK